MAVRLSVEKLFLHNNFFPFWHTMMKLHTCIGHHPKRTSIDFKVKRSKVKVIFPRTITPFPFGIQWWYFTHVLTMTREGPLLIWGSKCQGHIWTLNFLLFPHDNSISVRHTLMILHTYIDHDPRRTFIDLEVKMSKGRVIFGIWTCYRFHTMTLYSLGIQWWYFTKCIDHEPRRISIDFGIKKSKDQGHIWTSKCYRFRMKTPFPFGIHMYWPWPEKPLYWFWVKRSKVKVIFGLTTFFMSQGDPYWFWGQEVKA